VAKARKALSKPIQRQRKQQQVVIRWFGNTVRIIPKGFSYIAGPNISTTQEHFIDVRRLLFKLSRTQAQSAVPH